MHRDIKFSPEKKPPSKTNDNIDTSLDGFFTLSSFSIDRARVRFDWTSPPGTCIPEYAGGRTEQTGRHACKLINILTYTQIDRQRERERERETDTGRWMDDRHIGSVFGCVACQDRA